MGFVGLAVVGLEVVGLDAVRLTVVGLDVVGLDIDRLWVVIGYYCGAPCGWTGGSWA